MNKQEAEQYREAVLTPLLERYSEDDIYNVDETGLFFKLLPDRTYTLKGESCHGGKLSKERVTLLLGSNMSGTDKIKPLVVGKSAKPRCFNRVDVGALPVIYKSNRTAWMTGQIFNEWQAGIGRCRLKTERFFY